DEAAARHSPLITFFCSSLSSAHHSPLITPHFLRVILTARPQITNGEVSPMAPKNKPYEQFGPYILFKKLESDALSELWRAARVENGQLGGLFALRRFTGGNREALAASATNAKSIVTGL